MIVLSEEKRKNVIANIAVRTNEFDILNKFSSLTRLYRVTAYCRRFITKKSSRPTGVLTVAELQWTRLFWTKKVQRDSYASEIKNLTLNRPLDNKSSLLRLHTFLDKDGLVRVGGRIRNAAVEFNFKHPIILPKNSHLSKLIVWHAHLATLHGGCQQTLNYIRDNYWIINARSVVRSEIHKCMTCLKLRPPKYEPLMADLPCHRVTPSRAFLNCGIDYAGPISIKAARGRGYVPYKGYVAVFICCSTKAVHLEAVTDLSTPGFLAAFRRFCSRRGLPANVYSDRGTNFVGAANELKQLLKQVLKLEKEIAEQLSTQGIQWHFNPPLSPHFGGLWEAAVKSFKYHFRRMINDRILTFEEFSTLLTQIEACLNSRPLYPMSNKPRDLSVLTPAHFLIGDVLNSVPEPCILQIKPNYLEKWRFIQQMQQHFWKQWSSSYLTQLQQRNKWTTTSKNIKVGDIVLLKEERLAPMKWLLGRVEQVHPGPDGTVRIVTIRCRNTSFMRPVVKVCPLEL